LKIKTVLWIVSVAIILALIPAGILFYQNQRLKDQVSQYAGEQNINYKALTESLQRAETKQARSNKELTIFAEQNGINIKAVEQDLQNLDGRLEAVASTKAKTTTVVHNHYPSDSTTSSEIEVPTCKQDGRPIDIYGYTKRIETKELTDSNGMRVADVSFSAAQKRPWSSKVYSLEYNALSTIGRGTNNQLILSTELTVENPETQPGKIFRIKGVESRVIQAPEPGPTFDWWDPALLLLTIPALIAYPKIDFSASLSLGFSVWSYGRDWRVLGITAGYDAFQNAFRASLVPFLYNIGEPLPLLSSLYIFLDIGISSQADVSIGLGIGTRL